MKYVLVVLLALGCAGALRASDGKTFSYTFPQEFLTELVTRAIREAQAKDKSNPIRSVSIGFEPGGKITMKLTARANDLLDLAQKNLGWLTARAFRETLKRVVDPDIVFRFSGRIEAIAREPYVPKGAKDAAPVETTALAFSFGTKGIGVDLRTKRFTLLKSVAGLELLGLLAVERHLTELRLLDWLVMSSKIRRAGKTRIPALTGHRFVFHFLADKFPFVPFQLDAARLATDDQALTIGGRRK